MPSLSPKLVASSRRDGFTSHYRRVTFGGEPHGVGECCVVFAFVTSPAEASQIRSLCTLSQRQG